MTRSKVKTVGMWAYAWKPSGGLAWDITKRRLMRNLRHCRNLHKSTGCLCGPIVRIEVPRP